MSEARRSRTLFWIVLGLTLFQYVFLIADRRLPLGHETGTLYGIRYYFMTCAAQSGTPPLWMPFATQGTPSNWAWFEQGGLFQNAVLLAAPLFRGRSFLPLFHLGMLVEELLFLVGVWLLASRHFRSPYTVFFVAVAGLGSCLWIDHAAQNLGAIAALPLLLHLLHEFLEKKSRRCLFLAGSLAILQALGKPPALALFIPAAAALYGIGYAVLFKFPLRDRLREVSWGRRDLSVGAALLGIALMVGVGAFAGTGELVYAPGARWTIRGLLDGAGLGNPLQYLDLGMGLAPSLDATVYCGYFTLAFALLALAGAGLRRSVRLLGFLAGSLIALSLLTLLLAVLLPIPFPSRPPVPGVPLVRLFVIFLAGFGVQGMVERRQETSPRTRSAGVLLTAGAAGLFGLSAIAVLFSSSAGSPALAEQTRRLMTLGGPPESVSPLPLKLALFSDLTGMSALMAGLAGGILLLWSSGFRRAPLALGLALLVHPLDVFSWKFRMTWLKTCSLSPPRAEAQRLEGLPWVGHRVPDHDTNARFRLLQPRVAPFPGFEDLASYGAGSWLDESYWFADLPASRSGALYWAASIDRAARALGGADPTDPALSVRLSGDKLRPDEACVASFEADTLQVEVRVSRADGTLRYADSAHPSWTALVDRRPSPIQSGAEGYKSVQLPEGGSRVEFRFRSPARTACGVAIGLIAFLWTAVLCRRTARLLGARGHPGGGL
ncbi:MAG TPA: hypothetical protein VJB14_17485 [Planctomycetota bacterium]|nr:hypothetical protein [Planctomycetota bacterium]